MSLDTKESILYIIINYIVNFLTSSLLQDLSKPGRFNPCVTELHNMLMKTPFRLPPSSPLAPNPDPDYDSPTGELIYVYTTVLETG